MLTPCHYSIGTIKIFNRVLYNYNIDFYTNKDLIKSCLTGKYCENRRTMTLKIINGNLYKQYTIIHSGKLSKMICVDLEGNIVNKNNGCTN
ncbi:MAG: hypothetical protein B7Y59_12940 [Burkholderiales bacterium 35-55-47]|nr:MAG: hypothetical protein B7Y59_12940 [Burkholderiales bacterium 35-55-47]